MDIQKVRKLLSNISMDIFGTKLQLTTDYDAKARKDQNARVYMQVRYISPCSKTGKIEPWKGRKWYLSTFMTEDEVVKTAYLAFETAVRHEILEGFRFNGMPVFNPHTPYTQLLKVSPKEDRRVEGQANFDF